MKNSAVWAYVEIGDALLRVGVREDGALLSYASRSIIPAMPADAVWRTYRSVEAAAARVDVTVDSLNNMALIGPNGGRTRLACELARTGERDGRTYTTEEICSKFGAPDLAAKIVAFYTDEEEIEAAA